VQLSETASWLLVIGYLVLSLGTIVLLGAVAVGLSKLNAKLEDLTVKAEPLLAKTDQILTLANDKITSIGDKAEGILTQGEETAESVHEKVDKTATAVQRTVYAPIIGLNSFAAGVSRGVETFGRLQRHERHEINGAAVREPHRPETKAKAYDNVSNGQEAAEARPIPAGKETV